MKRLFMWFAFVAVVAAVVVSPASGAKPTIERIAVNEIGVVDDFLSEECGVPVTLDAIGHVTIRTFDDSGTGLRRVFTINVALTAHAGDNVIRFRDVGADILRVAPDGTEILMIVGQLPFEFTGVLKLNNETGEVILEPQHTLEDDVAAACAALTA